MEIHALRNLMKGILSAYPRIGDLLMGREQSSSHGTPDFETLCDRGYILFEINEETVVADASVKCRLIVSCDEETLHTDILCAHEAWRSVGTKQRPAEIGALLYDAIHEKASIHSKPLRFRNAKQIAGDHLTGGFTILFGTQDFLSAERKNPFPAYEVITQEILKRLGESKLSELLQPGSEKASPDMNTLLERGALQLSQSPDIKQLPTLFCLIDYSTQYQIAMNIVGNSEDSIWEIHDVIEDMMSGIPGVKLGIRGEIQSLEEGLLFYSSGYSLAYDPETIHDVIDPAQRGRKKPNFFCSVAVLDHLLNNKTSDEDAVHDLTVSVIELPFWFAFTQDADNWSLKAFSQGELFSRSPSYASVKGGVQVDKNTGVGRGTAGEELKDHMQMFYIACKNLSCFIETEGLQTLCSRLDPEKAGILLTLHDDTIEYQVVSGKDRPDLACTTLSGEVVEGRPYMEDFWERSKFDLMDWEGILKLAEAGDIEAMDKAAGAYLNGEESLRYSVEADVEKAVYWFRKMAEAGHSNGMFNLGLHYAKGYGVDRDFEQAAYWMEQAALAGDPDALESAKEYRGWHDLLQKAEKGDANAQAAIANAYMSLGNSLAQAGAGTDYAESVKWARKAAEQGSGEAFWVLALAYEHGRGVEQDIPQAVRYYARGAELGHANCQHSLGCFYMRGDVVEENHRKGFALFSKSAAQGYGLAMRDLGRCYQFGSGTMGNMKTAIEWYEKANEVLQDPELARDIAFYRSMAETDAHWDEDYPGDFEEGENDPEMPDPYLTGIAPDAVSAAWRYEDELDQQGYLPDEAHGDDAWGELPRVRRKALEGDPKAIAILKALEELG